MNNSTNTHTHTLSQSRWNPPLHPLERTRNERTRKRTIVSSTVSSPIPSTSCPEISINSFNPWSSINPAESSVVDTAPAPPPSSPFLGGVGGVGGLGGAGGLGDEGNVGGDPCCTAYSRGVKGVVGVAGARDTAFRKKFGFRFGDTSPLCPPGKALPVVWARARGPLPPPCGLFVRGGRQRTFTRRCHYFSEVARRALAALAHRVSQLPHLRQHFKPVATGGSGRRLPAWRRPG